jgi:putative membrane protein
VALTTDGEVISMMYDNNWHGGWGWGAWLAMGLMMLAFVGVLVAVLVVVLRSPTRHAGEPTSEARDRSDEARRILDVRFARGEIDADEYAQRRDVLRAR